MIIAKRLALVTGFAAAVIGGGGMAQVTVLQAAGPSAANFPPGTMLTANKPVQLRTGDRVTVMDGEGPLQIGGPGELFPNRPSATRNPRLVDLLGRFRSGSTAGSGAARGQTSGPLITPRNIWQVAVSSPGSLPRADGEEYTVTSTDDLDDNLRFIWQEVKPPSTGWPEFARQLTDKNCDNQLKTTWAAMPPPGS